MVPTARSLCLVVAAVGGVARRMCPTREGRRLGRGGPPLHGTAILAPSGPGRGGGLAGRERGPCRAQVRRVEALVEAAVHRPEELPRLLAPSLPDAQPGEAVGGAQLPGQGTLPSGQLDRLEEPVSGSGLLGCPLQQLALEAEKLRVAPLPAVAGRLLQGRLQRADGRIALPEAG